MACIYKVTNKLNGKSYIGATKHTIEYRKTQHENHALNKIDSSPIFHRALRKYGFSNFDWLVLFDGLDDDDLFVYERAKIRHYNTKHPYGYNMTDGGEGWSGQVFTDEHKSKISAALIGRTIPREIVEKVQASRRGYRHSEETKNKISQSHIGKIQMPHTEEAKVKISEYQKGRKKPAGHGQKVSKGRQGMKFTDEHRKNLSLAAKAAHKKRKEMQNAG